MLHETRSTAGSTKTAACTEAAAAAEALATAEGAGSAGAKRRGSPAAESSTATLALLGKSSKTAATGHAAATEDAAWSCTTEGGSTCGSSTEWASGAAEACAPHSRVASTEWLRCASQRGGGSERRRGAERRGCGRR